MQAQNGVLLAKLPAAVDDFLGPTFHFRVTTLNRIKVQIGGVGAALPVGIEPGIAFIVAIRHGTDFGRHALELRALGGFSFGTFVQSQLQQRLAAAGTPAERLPPGRLRRREIKTVTGGHNPGGASATLAAADAGVVQTPVGRAVREWRLAREQRA